MLIAFRFVRPLFLLFHQIGLPISLCDRLPHICRLYDHINDHCELTGSGASQHY
jgi:hypothetical protein